MTGRVRDEPGFSLEDLGLLDAKDDLLNDPKILGFLRELDTTSCGKNHDKIEILSTLSPDSSSLSKCPPVEDTFTLPQEAKDGDEDEDEEYDSGFYRQLIEDESQNRKFAKIRKSVELAIQCSAKDVLTKIEKYISTEWPVRSQEEKTQFLYSTLESMGRMIFDVTEKGEIEFLAKTWERRGGISYEDEEDERKISLLTLNLGGEENAIFVKKTRAITKKYMYRAMKQTLEQLVKDFDLNEAENMLI